MKAALFCFFLMAGVSAHAQYYYKDIIGTRESSELVRTYAKAGISAVQITSYDAEGTKNDDLAADQTFSKPYALLRTTTRSGDAGASVLLSYADAESRVVRTIDSSATLTSTTDYAYNADGTLRHVKSSSTDTSKRLNETEEHHWEYRNGNVARMLRIINGVDTTVVDFKVENGNVTEEWSTRRGIKSDPVYYYYNAQNRLTDIVRYNGKAKRLLPEYMFEYAADGKVVQKITVPSNSSAYLIWRYQYNEEGLKIREAIYDRYKTLNGKIEYRYSRSE